MVLLRGALGAALRRRRVALGRTLREVSADAKVSLGYLSEVERGHKEPSSELLSSICAALGLRLSELLHQVGDDVAMLEPVVLETAVLEPALLTVVEAPDGDSAPVVAAA